MTKARLEDLIDRALAGEIVMLHIKNEKAVHATTQALHRLRKKRRVEFGQTSWDDVVFSKRLEPPFGIVISAPVLEEYKFTILDDDTELSKLPEESEEC